MLLLGVDGLPGTVIESQVLLLARELRAAGVADFEVLVGACFDDLHRLSLRNRARAEELAGVPVHVIRMLRPAVPFAAVVNAMRAWRAIRRTGGRFTHIQGRPDHGALVAGLVARVIGARAVWDCRGDAEAEMLERPRPAGRVMRTLVRLRLLTSRLGTRLAGRLCHRAIFVSRPLYEARRRDLGAKPAEIIPCVASPTMFFFDPALRARTRASLAYADDDVVFIYSGGMAHYQCFEETVRLFEDHLLRDSKARLLVVTPRPEQALPYLARLPKTTYTLRAAEFSEVNAYLNAADCAFMLRAPSRVNAAASPTKFAEYGLAGLPVVMRDTVPDSHAIAARIGNLVGCEAGRLGPIPRLDRAEIMRRYREVLTRERYHAAYERLYAP